MLFGLVFTAGGLVYTAKTWETGQETLRTTQQQQITDRYTKAVEQIGSDKSVEVRIGGLYALERIAKDSPSDAETIRHVIVAFILERDRPATSKGDDRWKPEADVGTALRVLGTFPRISVTEIPPLIAAHFEFADWQYVYLTGADLSGANLNGADLAVANLNGANLFGADLTVADLSGADLSGADLRYAYLNYADLNDALLNGANLTNAKLGSADLRGADLRGADLRGAKLDGSDSVADLRGADLRNVRGMTPEEIRKVAKIDKTTKF
ncbi:pentapeptide repeat protein [Nonomuraea polychroma]|uniref:Pentapeptide repeat protein n=1 Tax=Nonomuraea polychroma TaxID=46176 RepID=A0A438M7X9_9ACTN|nr:pentapeptide repeat protein [Nonomuraea polychroma]